MRHWFENQLVSSSEKDKSDDESEEAMSDPGSEEDKSDTELKKDDLNLESEGDKSDPESEDDKSNPDSEDDNSNPESEDDNSNPESEDDNSNPESEDDESNPESEDDESNPESNQDKSDPEGKTKSVRSLQTQIFSALEELKTPGAFACSTIDESLPNPGLFVPPHGLFGLPLSADEAQKIISQASQSPFGKGEETIVDTSVRKCWELNPDQFSLNNPVWNKAMEKILDTSCLGLGLVKGTGKQVSAELYKLLLYEPGAFFKAHKDSEKVPGMFATLVVCLPSPHKGGKVVLTLNNETNEFETATSSMFGTSYAAWYADVTHEVLPIISGYRLVLTYNLIRRTGFVIPSFDSVLGTVGKISTLLQEYESQLKMEGNKLPPIILRKLKHKYTNTDLQLNTLKPRDLAQVQTLSHLANKLRFQIYLATLELKVMREEMEYEGSEYDERSQTLENMVTLNGKLIMKSFCCKEGWLIDTKRQDAGKRSADEVEEGEYSGNQGTPITWWYRDTVVVLVPPSKQVDFIFEFNSRGTVIAPLLSELIEEYSKDPAEKVKLEQLLERALEKYSSGGYYCYSSQFSESIPPWYQQAVATALNIGRIDLFDKACEKTRNKIIIYNACLLGCWAAKNGIASVSDRLMEGLQMISSVAKMVEFLKSVAEGFETAEGEPGTTEKINFKQWSDQAVFTAIGNLRSLTEEDAVTLVHSCKTLDPLFESKVVPVILKSGPMVKIAFVNEVLNDYTHTNDQQLLLEKIIHSVWFEFFNNVDPIEKDVRHIFESTVRVFSSGCVDTMIIPAMLSAIPSASKKCTTELFILLVRMVIKNKLIGFKLPAGAVPPPLHKRLVQALLVKFLISNVRREPRMPTNWSLPIHRCKCNDCCVVNRFLQDPVRVTHSISCPKARRVHLYEVFTNSSKDCGCRTPTYDVETIHGCTPNVWRITKHRRGLERDKSEWIRETKFATETLSGLKKDEVVTGRLEAYLQPYYNAIMNATIKELPDSDFLVSMPQVSETSKNGGPREGQKREGSVSDPLDDGLRKRLKQETDGDLLETRENVAPNLTANETGNERKAGTSNPAEDEPAKRTIQEMDLDM